MNPILRLGVISAALLLGQQALAQEPIVSSSLAASRVEVVDGKSVLHPAAEARPGDVLEYRATYTNHGKAAVAHLLATVPVPAGTTLIADSPVPAAVQASTDAQSFAPVPLMRSVAAPDGHSRLEPVPLSEYRALRWDVASLSPGRNAVVRLHVRVDAPVLSAADRH